jgi:hypothetical protein
MTIQPRKCRSDAIMARSLAEKPESSFAPSHSFCGCTTFGEARNATMEEWGFLRGCRYLLHDRDTKFCASFRELIESGSVKTIRLPARSPNLNSFAERWVRSVRGIPLEAHPVRRVFAATSFAAIHRALPRGAQPPGQRESDFVSSEEGRSKR